ncbi:hypothetical protein AB0451_19715 [Streptomyces sp. NPDC052000]|uniref:hypothetical protein n=1 Tax=Streptomyces sp. NPDC052000 TaxID=3155676 RepID=UPI00344BF75A
MKADPKGPGHFPEPIALIAKLDGELGGNHVFNDLKKHQTLLIGTRDKTTGCRATQTTTADSGCLLSEGLHHRALICA